MPPWHLPPHTYKTSSPSAPPPCRPITTGWPPPDDSPPPKKPRENVHTSPHAAPDLRWSGTQSISPTPTPQTQLVNLPQRQKSIIRRLLPIPTQRQRQRPKQVPPCPIYQPMTSKGTIRRPGTLYRTAASGANSPGNHATFVPPAKIPPPPTGSPAPHTPTGSASPQGSGTAPPPSSPPMPPSLSPPPLSHTDNPPPSRPAPSPLHQSTRAAPPRSVPPSPTVHTPPAAQSPRFGEPGRSMFRRFSLGETVSFTV
jgi:hypothetical protein